MPRKIVAWACEFKCGFKVYTNRDKILNHEDGCFLNPDLKACKTCGAFIPAGENNGGACEKEFLQEPTSGNWDGLRINCPKWEPK